MPNIVEPAVPRGAMGALAQPSLSVDELTIRPWRVADVPAVVAAYADEAIQRWHVRAMTEIEARWWIDSWAERWARETGADWAVTDGDTVVGRVGVRRLYLADGFGEAAYWVMPAARGRAVATRALDAVTGWMFALGLNRMELTHSTLNTASCRVADKAGYVHEGTLRGRGRHADGWHDMHVHGRVRTTPGADTRGSSS